MDTLLLLLYGTFRSRKIKCNDRIMCAQSSHPVELQRCEKPEVDDVGLEQQTGFASVFCDHSARADVQQMRCPCRGFVGHIIDQPVSLMPEGRVSRARKTVG